MPAPTAYWRLNETAGNYLDISGNGFHCPAPSPRPGTAPGPFGEPALYLPSPNTTYLVANHSSGDLNLNSQDFTLTLWHYLDSKVPCTPEGVNAQNGTSQVLFYKGVVGDRSWVLDYDAGDFFSDYYGASLTSGNVTTRGASCYGTVPQPGGNTRRPPVQSWVFMVARYRAAARELDFSAGEANLGMTPWDTVGGHDGAAPRASAAPVSIGATGGGLLPMNGRLAHFGIWKGIALTDAQVAGVRNGGC